MKLRTVSNPNEVKARAWRFLTENEAQNCLGLGIIQSLITNPKIYPTFYLWLAEDLGEPSGVAWWTPPYSLGLTAMPSSALDLLLEDVVSKSQVLSSVVGPKQHADYFRDKFCKATGFTVKSTMEQRIYQASSVNLPSVAAGQLRAATNDDIELMQLWTYSFVRECGLNHDLGTIKKLVKSSVNMGNRYIWEANGNPATMASVGGPTPSGIRISSVYTPKELRGKGYGSAAVFSLTNKMLSQGRRLCFLYTDLANGTSNSIYKRIGYSPVSDSTQHSFSPNR